MTSEALITAATLSPTLRPRSSTASFVMDDVTVTPWPRSTTTCAVVAPLWTSTTLPLSWLRALSFINVLRHNRRRFSQPQSGRQSMRCDAAEPQDALHQAAAGSLPENLTCGAGPWRAPLPTNASLPQAFHRFAADTAIGVSPARPNPARLSGILPPL